jgi:hypothetical protein
MKAHTIGAIVLAVTKMRISTMLRSQCDVTAKHVRLRFSQFAIVQREQVSGREQSRFPCVDYSESLSRADIKLTHRNVTI